MSLITDLMDGVLEGTGWAAGVAIVLGVAAVSSRRGSPLVKSVMKGYLIASERVKELTAEAGEQLQDLYAEAKAEYQTGAPAAPPAEVAAAAATAAPTPRRRGRPPRAAASEATAPAAEGQAPRRRGRPPRAESAAATEGAGTAARRPGRPRGTGQRGPASEAA